MKKFHLLFVLLFGISLLFTSCSKEAPTKENTLSRLWTFSSSTMGLKDSSNFFKFSTNQDGSKDFSFFIEGEDSKGKWELTDSSNVLTLTSFAKIGDLQIDSVVQTADEDGDAIIQYYHQNEKISTITKNGIKGLEIDKQFVVDSLSGYYLSLSPIDFPNQNLVFKYEPEVIPSSVSFYSVTRGLLGILGLVFIAFLCSANRKAISWSLVIKGLLLQIILGLCVLYVPFIASVFDAISSGFIDLIGFTNNGVDFIFGQFGKGEIQSPLINFAFTILPTIIFFSALMSMLYYLGILQKVVYVFAWVMKKTLKLSGAESLSAAGNIFLGQTESPLLVKPYLDKMTKSEIMTLMTGGMATIAGGVLAAYISFLGGGDPVEEAIFAKHLLTASIMSAPAAVVAAKMLVPETEKFNEDMTIPKDKIGSNILEAISNGTTDGIKLAVNVGAMLLVFTAIMFMFNAGLNQLGEFTGLNEVIAENTTYPKLSFEFLLGYTFAPVAGLMGVDNWNDMKLMGQLLGEKTIINEFVAYVSLGDMKAEGAFETRKAMVMSTYMLCGFANFASIGIQIGGIGALAPTRKGLLSKLGMRALIGGTLACLFTAVVIGMLM